MNSAGGACENLPDVPQSKLVNNPFMDKFAQSFLPPFMVKKELEKLFYDKSKVEIYYQNIVDMMSIEGNRGYRARFRDFPRPKKEIPMENITQETLVIGADHDTGIPFCQSENLHQRIKNSKLVKIENCGHLSTWEKPKEVLKLVEDFLQ
ncbi:MAG: hypothetical protein C4K58_04150 [Flavobacteriaceae bacterium]|nr:MAG: hypothetical protein C4K58_04150 [Flavobacteriaceae bacterium]